MKKYTQYLTLGSSCWAKFLKMGALFENSPTTNQKIIITSMIFIDRTNR